MYKAIIFDSDGTLFDTNDQHVEAWRRAFASVGHDIPAGRIAVEVGKGGDKLVPAILGQQADERLSQELRHQHSEEFARLLEGRRIRVYPGVEELLAAVHKRGLKSVMATSSKQEHLDAIQQSAGLRATEMVDDLVTADDIESSKPAPDLVEAAVNKLHERPEACVMVGDTPYDAEASRKAGVACIGLLCGRQHSPEMLRNAGVRMLFRDPSELLQRLDEALREG
jgi:HAD superfamily hydrolase (TIGR01509 family)